MLETYTKTIKYLKMLTLMKNTLKIMKQKKNELVKLGGKTNSLNVM